MHNYKEIKIWQNARALVKAVYRISKQLPKEELYGLTSQIRRAAVSIPSNISEGAGRNSNNEFRHFLSIANGSSYELQTQIVISNKLNLLTEETTEILLTQVDEIQKMNYSFQKTISNIR